ncbi:MAG: hypothetical protein DRJ26_04540 [Candidatus Methanomethylicota archaeon]|uniref:Uncharacterized protein n=1 Tax=Thermoproteota archaeon TaxID=2056631 RepID=A0A497EYW3_9CREN|nr:MAG: hypothetical protein DRJ26_04540 [Candidatus Verstraetearchaeota archaeon]
MPILKYEKLEEMIQQMKKDGYVEQFTTKILHKYIAKFFGLGEGTRRNIHKAMAELDIIVQVGPGMWKWKEEGKA